MIHSSDLLQVCTFSDIDRWVIENWAVRGGCREAKVASSLPAQSGKALLVNLKLVGKSESLLSDAEGRVRVRLSTKPNIMK